MDVTESNPKPRPAPDGWSETAIKNDAGDLIAVITHPCAGAKWFVHYVGQWKTEKFNTKAEAVRSARKGISP